MLSGSSATACSKSPVSLGVAQLRYSAHFCFLYVPISDSVCPPICRWHRLFSTHGVLFWSPVSNWKISKLAKIPDPQTEVIWSGGGHDTPLGSSLHGIVAMQDDCIVWSLPAPRLSSARLPVKLYHGHCVLNLFCPKLRREVTLCGPLGVSCRLALLSGLNIFSSKALEI